MALVSAGRLVKGLQTEKETGQRPNELCDFSGNSTAVLNLEHKGPRAPVFKGTSSSDSFPKSMISKT